MTHEELRDQYELYVLGIADDPERNEIREHLTRGCEVCMVELKRAREVAALLAGSAADAAPSPKLRGRILASVGYEPRRTSWSMIWAAAAALSFVAAVYFSGREHDFAQQALQLREQIGRQNVELTRLNEAFAILNAPDTHEASFGEERPKPKGRVFLHPSQGVLLIASNLPPAPTGKRWEMWIIPKGAKPVPAGMFQSENDGSAMHVQRGPVDIGNTGAVAVTLEDAAGVPQPTSTPVIVAPITRGAL